VTLFEEIAAARATTSHSDDVREAVRTHLAKMCSMRRGSLLLSPDYGMEDPAYLFHSFPGGLDDWLLQLTEAVRRHEPRLHDVQVSSEPGDELDFTLRFEIRGKLAARARSEVTQFTATVDTTQRWSVR
jgi:type VI secretion system protein